MIFFVIVETFLVQCIVVSKETEKGGHKVNEKRKELDRKLLDVRVIDLVQNSDSETQYVHFLDQ